MADENVKIVISGDTTAIEARLVSLTKRFEELGGKAATDALSKMNSLERGIKQLDGSTGKATGVFGKFIDGIALGNLAAAAVQKGLNSLGDAIVDVTKAALEDAHQWNIVEGALKNAGLSVSTNLPKFQAMTDQLEMLSGVADNEISAGFAQMVRAGIDVSDQFNLMKIALDASAASGRPLASVIDLITKASAGADGALQKLGTEFGIEKVSGASFAQVMQEIGEKSAGAAKAAMSGAEGDLKQAGVAWERIKEAIGGPFVGLLGAAARGFNDLYTALNPTPPLLEDSADKVHNWSVQIHDLTDKLHDGKIGIKEFRDGLAGIGDDASGVKKVEAPMQDVADLVKDLYSEENDMSPSAVLKRMKLAAEGAATAIDKIKPSMPSMPAIPGVDMGGLDTLDTGAANKELQDAAAKRSAIQNNIELNDQNHNANMLKYSQENFDQIVAINEAAMEKSKETITAISLDLFDGLTSGGNVAMNLGKNLMNTFKKMAEDQIKESIANIIKKKAIAQAENAIKKTEIQADTQKSAAKTASSLPFPINLILAAATMAGLAYLTKGFDDPVNDAVALRSGKDYGRLFKQGAGQELGSPGFGELLNGKMAMRGGIAPAPQPSLTINFHGDVYEASAVTTIMNKIKEELYFGTNTLELNPLGITR